MQHEIKTKFVIDTTEAEAKLDDLVEKLKALADCINLVRDGFANAILSVDVKREQ